MSSYRTNCRSSISCIDLHVKEFGWIRLQLLVQLYWPSSEWVSIGPITGPRSSVSTFSLISSYRPNYRSSISCIDLQLNKFVLAQLQVLNQLLDLLSDRVRIGPITCPRSAVLNIQVTEFVLHAYQTLECSISAWILKTNCSMKKIKIGECHAKACWFLRLWYKYELRKYSH